MAFRPRTLLLILLLGGGCSSPAEEGERACWVDAELSGEVELRYAGDQGTACTLTSTPGLGTLWEISRDDQSVSVSIVLDEILPGSEAATTPGEVCARDAEVGKLFCARCSVAIDTNEFGPGPLDEEVLRLSGSASCDELGYRQIPGSVDTDTSEWIEVKSFEFLVEFPRAFVERAGL